ncbi:MAG: c-type cytochrome [Fibrobacteres bacterium]|nr:c-type cytochrome [Fibrobacterota bacterium]
MKMFFKILGGLVLLLVVGVGGFLAFIAIDGIPHYKTEPPDLKVEVTPERVARGKLISHILCSECHLDTKTGHLTGHRLPDLPPQFGVAYSKNLTHDKNVGIGGWTDGEIAFLLRTGIRRDGKYTPPWMPKLNRIADEDIYSIIAFLRSDDSLVQSDPSPDKESEPSFLVKFLTHVAFKPFRYPDHKIVPPDSNDKVAFGKYLALDAFDCFACHSGDFKKLNDREPEKSFQFFGGGNEMPDLGGRVIVTANLTPDGENGIGDWTEAEFVKAVREGIRPDGRMLRYPMTKVSELTEKEVGAIYAYLRTVPPLNHHIVRNFDDYGGAPLTEGKAIYNKYGCIACHGETGVGVGDLTLAKRDFPADSSLRSWIRNPPSFKPLTKMPSFQGLIKDEEFAPLIAYVRELGNR